MRIPSRRMPKMRRGTTWTGRIIGSAILAAIVAGYLYALWWHPVITGVITATLTIVLVRDRRRTRRHLTALADARRGESICEFSRSFDARRTDPWVIRAVYEQLQQQLRWRYPAFPVRASDRLIEDLRLDPDDIDMDLFHDVTERARRSRRDVKKNPLYGRIKTAADLVAFFCEQQRTS